MQHMPKHMLATIALILLSAQLNAQCLNTSQYPANAITPLTGGQTTTIHTCCWQTEFAVVTGIIPSASYTFIYGGGGWVTVREGAYDGPVVGQGDSPLTVEATTAQDLFAHWNTDSLCNTAQVCHASTVLMSNPGCDPPVASTSIINDCGAQQFSVEVEVQSLGDAPSVGLNWTVNNGAPSNLGGLQTGTYSIGPFPFGAIVDLVVMHAGNPGCNVAMNDLTNGGCAIVGCGPETYTYCYPNNAYLIQTFQGDQGYPLRITFTSGMVTNTGNDPLTIHDGFTPQDPVLFSGIGNNGDLTGITVTSTNPDHALTIRFTSNSSFSCTDGGLTPEWNYTVGCLDCEPASATVGEVETDCGAQGFSVLVNVTDMGSAEALQITNDAGLPPTDVNGTGVYTAGPFPIGTPVALVLENGENTLCSVSLGSFINTMCATIVDCEEPPLEQTYCYGEYDTEEWLYQSSGPAPLGIVFSAGTIENAAYDHLTIHDGTDQAAPILYDHVLGGTEQLAGLTVMGTGTSLFMRMTSDLSVSCASGSMTSWVWTVDCLDCETATATAGDVAIDCDAQSFTVPVNLMDMGSADTVLITNDAGLPPVEVTAAGSYMAGPFLAGVPVALGVMNAENVLCAAPLGTFLGTVCATPVDCEAPLQEHTYCYGEYDTEQWLYQSSGASPLGIVFSAGTIENAAYDHLTIYDGPDQAAPVLYDHVLNSTEQLAGLTVAGTGNVLYMRMTSDYSVSCASGAMTPWVWTVGCISCTDPQATFGTVADCPHNRYNVDVNVTGLGSGDDVLITDSWSGDTLSGIGLGNTVIGPIPMGVGVQVSVINGSNPFCSTVSEQLALPAAACVITACDLLQVEHCYADADTVWFIYTSGESVPVTIFFNSGQLLPGDQIRVFNGLTTDAQLVYAGNFGGDISGYSLTSNNPDNALLVQVVSDGTGSCATGEATPALHWSVGCGFTGLDLAGGTAVGLFPNPSTGMVQVMVPWPGIEVVRAEVFDPAGRKVQETRSLPHAGGAMLLDLGGLADGRYALRLSTTTRSVVTAVELRH
ncbi:MAG: hypothetical protein JST41_08750 [Bacteroidetes bacterium]|nr:hypothetical protein [Bacteroidota bacterium]HMU12694.1 hypothetical protein [Flavobacteriales bacterium]